MAIGQKLYEESGKVTGFKITKVHPVEGTVMEISFMADVKGFSKFPSGRNIGSSVVRQYPHGMMDTSLQGNIMTVERDQIFYWAHEKSKIVEGGKKTKGAGTISLFTHSQKLSWINNIILADEVEIDLDSQQFTVAAYEWI